jgi:hypothetical protein
MNKRVLLLVSVLVVALDGCASHASWHGGGARRTVRTLSAEVADAAAAPVDVATPSGRLAVEAWNEPRVEVRARIECRSWSCEAAKSVRLHVAQEGGRIRVRFDGWPHVSSGNLQAVVTVRMPRGAPLDAQVGAGRIDISGLEADVDAQLGVGRLQLTMAEAAAATVGIDTGLGAATLATASGHREERAPLGASLRWQGRGLAKVDLHCGVGAAGARLG